MITNGENINRLCLRGREFQESVSSSCRVCLFTLLLFNCGGGEPRAPSTLNFHLPGRLSLECVSYRMDINGHVFFLFFALFIVFLQSLEWYVIRDC